MNFWDSSAVLPLLIAESASVQIAEIFRKDITMIVWWGTEVECVSALSRRERETPAAASAIAEGLSRLDRLRNSWHEIQPLPVVRQAARRHLRTHALRAADALQLAAAVTAADGNTGMLQFICLDERLRVAARIEGFSVLPE